MLASLEEPPINQAGLVYEPKYDGIRALVDVRPPAKRGGKPTVALYSRNGREKHAQFPGIVRALAAMARKLDGPLLLDGEIVAVDARGVPLGFQHIQGRIHLTSAGDIERAERAQPAALVLFDILRDGNEDLRGQPLAARRLRLQKRDSADTRTEEMGSAERHRPRRRPFPARARPPGGLGGADREGRRLRVPQRQAHALVAQAEASQAAGVRHRRVDRAAAVARALRRVARGLLRPRRTPAMGRKRRDGIQSGRTGSSRDAPGEASNSQESVC